jgi:hypothetical protein
VRGIILAHRITPELKLAARSIHHLKLLEYNVAVQLTAA